MNLHGSSGNGSVTVWLHPGKVTLKASPGRTKGASDVRTRILSSITGCGDASTAGAGTVGVAAASAVLRMGTLDCVSSRRSRDRFDHDEAGGVFDSISSFCRREARRREERLLSKTIAQRASDC